MKDGRPRASVAECIFAWIAFGPMIATLKLVDALGPAVLVFIIPLFIFLLFRIAVLFPLSFFIAAAFYLVFIAWTILPLPLPTPPFRSRFINALCQAQAKEMESGPGKAAGWIRQLPQFLPIGVRIEEAERLLRRERFKLARSRNLDAKAVSEWRVSGHRLREYSRCTAWHPLARMGWQIYLFTDASGHLSDIRAGRYYDGL
jgi:hypothetical protein